MATAHRAPDLALLASVATGSLIGVAYAAFDAYAESRIGSGTLAGALSGVHTVVDRSLPVAVGALLGVYAHYRRLRTRLAAAEEAAARVEALRSRLHKVERDQAVWVLAAAVLHEVNNPLHALGLLLDELSASGDPTQQAELVTRARAQSSRALSHLRTLRSLGSVEEPRAEVLPLDALVATIAEDARALAAEDGVSVLFECQGPVSARGDTAYVRTIVENLLDNSLAALRDQGRGHITVQVTAGAGLAIVTVGDDAPAPAPEVAAALFEPLVTTKARGLGLGLPIARALARAMRGDLTFETADGKRFRLELPEGGAA